VRHLSKRKRRFEATSLLQNWLELTRAVKSQYTAHATVVTTSNKLALHENCWHRGASNLFGELDTEPLSVLNFIQFDHFILSTVLIQDLLCFNTERSGGEGIHDARCFADLLVELGTRCLHIVVAG